MSTYRKIHGRSIQAVTTDPTGDITEGQVWYNTTSDTFKSVLVNEAWSSGASMTDARADLAGAGTQTAGLAMAGIDRPSTPKNVSEEYNGSGWASGGNTPGAKSQCAGAGSQTAAIVFGGASSSNTTFEYDGSSFSAGGTMNTGRSLLAGFGTATAGVGAGGYTPGPTNQNAVEEYNGSAWTAGNTLTTARRSISGTGPTESAGMVFGGNTGSVTGATEEYDGTNWTTGGSLNTAREGMGGSGSSTLGLAFSGYTTTNVTNSEEYNGTSWSEGPDVATARRFLAGSVGGTSPAALAFGGFASADTGATEEFNKSANVITAAAWAAGGSISTVRTNVGSTSEGSQTAAMVWGGRTGPPPSGPYTSNKSDTYDGSSFSTAPNLNTAARTRAGGGTTSAAWCAGGTQPAYINATEEFDGSSWTSVTNAPLVFFASGTGVQTAGLIVGINSSSPPGSDAFPGISLEYDGTNWATGGSPSADRTGTGCSGTQTAGTLISGQPVPYGTRVTTIEEYDGSSWTSGGNDTIAVSEIQHGARGPQTATLITGGNINPPQAGITNCRTYDGTTAATTASMGSGRRGHGSDGGQTSGLVMTGLSAGPPANNNPNYTANAEEFTAETTALNVKTLTQS